MKFLFYIFSVLFVTTLACASVYSQSKVTDNIYTADSTFRHDLSYSVGDIGWIEGTWQGKGLGGEVEEVWSAPMGKHMVGTFRYYKDGQLGFSEYCAISETADGIKYRVKHFNPDFTGWEEKDGYAEFPLIRLEENKAFFDGATFVREGNALIIYVLISGESGSSEEAFNYKRVH